MSKWQRYPGDRSGRIEPEEIPWCEDCGASLPFCECGVPLDDGRANWEYERKRDKQLEKGDV
mgnify:CR=1 FL=1